MKLLIYQWEAYLQYDIYAICKEQGITYEVFLWTFADKNNDEAFEKWFRETVDCRQFDAVLSINYWPLLSKVAQEQGIKYIAWCYDNPLNVLEIEETLGNPVNYVFLFDRIQYEKYKTAGFDTVWHLPLGVNRTRLGALTISPVDRRRYETEVSFVGNLYESQLGNILKPLNEYTKGYIEGLIEAQFQVYGYYMLDELLSDKLLEDINGQYLERKPDTEFRLSKEALSWAMASEVTRRERILLLNLFGRRYDTRFYSYQDCDMIQAVEKYKGVDYVTEMPKVFACSKINLNPTLRIIQTGIPLRAFDIMGCGGFLLSNYQQELLEFYENERELVVYESPEDAVAKADFYIKHEGLRIEIAKRGREKTLREHSLQGRMQEILSIAGI